MRSQRKYLQVAFGVSLKKFEIWQHKKVSFLVFGWKHLLAWVLWLLQAPKALCSQFISNAGSRWLRRSFCRRKVHLSNKCVWLDMLTPIISTLQKLPSDLPASLQPTYVEAWSHRRHWWHFWINLSYSWIFAAPLRFEMECKLDPSEVLNQLSALQLAHLFSLLWCCLSSSMYQLLSLLSIFLQALLICQAEAQTAPCSRPNPS